MKELFTAEPILKIYILSLLIVVKIDILDFALGYILKKITEEFIKDFYKGII